MTSSLLKILFLKDVIKEELSYEPNLSEDIKYESRGRNGNVSNWSTGNVNIIFSNREL